MGRHTAAKRGWYRHSSLVFSPPCVCHNLLINPGWSCWWYQRWWTSLLFLHPHRDRSLFISPCSDRGGKNMRKKKPTGGWPGTAHTHMTDGQSINDHAIWWGSALLLHVISLFKAHIGAKWSLCWTSKVIFQQVIHGSSFSSVHFF